MPNIRMLTAQRELAEKERVKNQGTLKAQRSQEMDTQDVAKKTNTSEAARAFKKAQSDLRSAKAEEKLAETKAKYAAIGAAIGAIGTLVSIGAAAYQMNKGSGDDNKSKATKEGGSATKSGKGAEGAAGKAGSPQLDNKNNPSVAKPDKTTTPSNDSKSLAATSETIKKPETSLDKSKEVKSSPSERNIQDAKPGEVAKKVDTNPVEKSKELAKNPTEQKLDQQTKPTEKAKEVVTNPTEKKLDQQTNPTEKIKQVDSNPTEKKLEEKTVPTQKAEVENNDQVAKKEEKDASPTKKEEAKKTDPVDKKKEEQTNPTEKSKDKSWNEPQQVSNPDQGMFGSKQQAEAIKNLLKGITSLGGFESGEVRQWDLGSKDSKKSDGLKKLGENMSAVFKGQGAVNDLKASRAQSNAKKEVKGTVDSLTAQVNKIATTDAVLTAKEDPSKLTEGQKDTLKQAGIMDDKGNIDQKKLNDASKSLGIDGLDAGALRQNLAEQLNIIDGGNATGDNLTAAIDSTKGKVDAIKTALTSGLVVNQGAGETGGQDNLAMKDLQSRVNSLGDKGLIGDVRSQIQDNINRNGAERSNSLGERLVGKLTGNESKSKAVEDKMLDLRKKELSKDPVMAALIKSDQIKFNKDGSFELKSDSFFSGKAENAMAIGASALTPNKDGSTPPAPATTSQGQTATPEPAKAPSAEEKARVLVTIANSGGAASVAKTLNSMSPTERKDILGKMNVKDSSNIIAQGLLTGTLSDKEARTMVMETGGVSNTSTPEAQKGAIDTARSSASNDAMREVAALNGEERLGKYLDSQGVLTEEGKKFYSDPKNAQDALKLDNLSLLRSVTNGNGNFDPSKLNSLSPEQKASVNTLLNTGATNLAFREAAQSDSSLKSFADENGNLQSQFIKEDGTFNKDAISNGDPKKNIGGSKMTDANINKITNANEFAQLSDPNVNFEKLSPEMQNKMSNGSAQVINAMLNSPDEMVQKAGARIYQKLDSDQKNALGSAVDKSKIGGAKEAEKPTGFNSFLMYMNVGMPGIQFMLQQLDKMREAEEQKLEAKKKKEAAHKLMTDIAKNLKRTQGESGASGLQAAGGGIGGAK